MIHFIMTNIRHQDILVPGGWTAYIVEIEPSDEALAVYRPRLADLNMPVEDQMEACYEIVQMHYITGFVHKLRQSIKNNAEWYRGMWPELRDPETGVMAGFDPEELQRYYLPIYGRGIDSGAREAMREMARRAE